MRNPDNFGFVYRHLALALLCIGMVFLPESLAELLEYKRDAIIGGEWWRLWSGHFTHFTLMHAFVNCATLLLLTVLLVRVYSWTLILILFIFGPLVISLSLMSVVHEMAIYRGASALAALFLAMLIVQTIERAHGISAFMLYALIVTWLVKLSVEAAGGMSLSNLSPSIHVAWQAHVAGILAGIAVSSGLKWLIKRTEHADSVRLTRTLHM